MGGARRRCSGCGVRGGGSWGEGDIVGGEARGGVLGGDSGGGAWEWRGGQCEGVVLRGGAGWWYGTGGRSAGAVLGWHLGESGGG